MGFGKHLIAALTTLLAMTLLFSPSFSTLMSALVLDLAFAGTPVPAPSKDDSCSYPSRFCWVLVATAVASTTIPEYYYHPIAYDTWLFLLFFLFRYTSEYPRQMVVGMTIFHSHWTDDYPTWEFWAYAALEFCVVFKPALRWLLFAIILPALHWLHIIVILPATHWSQKRAKQTTSASDSVAFLLAHRRWTRTSRRNRELLKIHRRELLLSRRRWSVPSLPPVPSAPPPPSTPTATARVRPATRLPPTIWSSAVCFPTSKLAPLRSQVKMPGCFSSPSHPSPIQPPVAPQTPVPEPDLPTSTLPSPVQPSVQPSAPSTEPVLPLETPTKAKPVRKCRQYRKKAPAPTPKFRATRPRLRAEDTPSRTLTTDHPPTVATDESLAPATNHLSVLKTNDSPALITDQSAVPPTDCSAVLPTDDSAVPTDDSAVLPTNHLSVPTTDGSPARAIDRSAGLESCADMDHEPTQAVTIPAPMQDADMMGTQYTQDHDEEEEDKDHEPTQTVTIPTPMPDEQMTGTQEAQSHDEKEEHDKDKDHEMTEAPAAPLTVYASLQASSQSLPLSSSLSMSSSPLFTPVGSPIAVPESPLFTPLASPSAVPGSREFTPLGSPSTVLAPPVSTSPVITPPTLILPVPTPPVPAPIVPTPPVQTKPTKPTVPTPPRILQKVPKLSSIPQSFLLATKRKGVDCKIKPVPSKSLENKPRRNVAVEEEVDDGKGYQDVTKGYQKGYLRSYLRKYLREDAKTTEEEREDVTMKAMMLEMDMDEADREAKAAAEKHQVLIDEETARVRALKEEADRVEAERKKVVLAEFRANNLKKAMASVATRKSHTPSMFMPRKKPPPKRS